ncbi:MAG: hypothetical protein ACF8PN_07990 [Phycisphaerales bacterium]
MPAIRVSNQAAAPNAVNGLNFEDIPAGGALLSLYASQSAAGNTIGLKVGSEQFLVDASPNIEAAPDIVDIDRDQILFQEPVPAGKMFVPVTGAGAVNFLIVLEYAAP